ncbi:DMT family transporter [Candidatus Gottesmanbacteria bacterium]|nr:DMT family transporter [Candidatus Gottesmanbacteria bacterium]
MLDKFSERTKGVLALVILAAVYGGVGVVTRYLNQYFPILQQLYLRLFIALILGLILFRKKLSLARLTKISGKEWLLILSRTFGTFVIASPLWVAGANIAKLANVGFIDSLPLTAAISLILGLEKFTAKKGLLVLLSFIGVVILSVKDFGNFSSFGLGEFLILLSGFFFAYRNFSRRWHSKLLNDAEITMLMLALGLLMVFLTSIFLGEKAAVSSWNGELLFMLIIGGSIMIANIFLTNYGFARVSPVLGNNVVNMEAAFAILFGFLFYGEVMNLRELLGGLLIVASVVRMNRLK